jgi:hypothetical protein
MCGRAAVLRNKIKGPSPSHGHNFEKNGKGSWRLQRKVSHLFVLHMLTVRVGERGKTALFVAFDCRTLEKLEKFWVFPKILDTYFGNLSC